MLPLLFALAQVALAPVGRAHPATAAHCIDPATPFRTLALNYSAWPPPRTGRETSAFADLKKFLRTGNPHTYHTTLLEYTNIDEMSRDDENATLALAVLYTAGPDLNYPLADGYRHTAVSNFSNADDYAARTIAHVIKTDSAKWLVAVALTRIALVSPEKKKAADAIVTLQHLLARDPGNTTLRLALSDLLVAQGRAHDALVLLGWPNDEAAAAGTSDDDVCIPQQHAIAQAMMLTGDTAGGVTLYLDALAHARPDELDRFHEDISVMATHGQLAEYSRLAPDKRSAWIRAFWQRDAASFARTLEARIVEQIIRADYADKNFRAQLFKPSSDKPIGWVSDTAHIVPWDVRGVIWARHGQPTERYRNVTISYDGCQRGYEAWVYLADGEPWIFEFSGQCPIGDWSMTTPLCGGDDFLGPPPDLDDVRRKAVAMPDSLTRREVYMMLARHDSTYAELLPLCQRVANKVPPGFRFNELIRKRMFAGEKLLAKAGWSSSAFPHFTNPVRMIVRAYQFRDAQRDPEIVAMSWVPTMDLAGTHSITSTYTLTDSSTSVTRVDNTSAVSAGDEQSGVIHGAATLHSDPVPNGILRIIVQDAADSTHGASRALNINVRNDRSAFAISDIVLADVDLDGALVRGTKRISPLPENAIQVGEQFRMFFEMYGLPAGADISTSVEIEKAGRGIGQMLGLTARNHRELSFNTVADTDVRGAATEDVTLTGDLDPGDYTIIVRVTLAGGIALERATTLHIDAASKRP